MSFALPGFFIVGLPDTAINESRERMRSAIRHSGRMLPRHKMTVNLAPAHIRKAGPSFDLAMCLAILVASGELAIPDDFAADSFTGELGLDGSLRPIHGALSLALCAASSGSKRLFLPAANAAEASLVPELEVIPISSLQQLISYFEDEAKIEPAQPLPPSAENSVAVDLASVRGQALAKRALEIAAAGSHNVLLSGAPGSGKTLLSRSLPGIMPSLELHEALEVTKIYSVAGLVDSSSPLRTARPWRSPHHSASTVSLVGGGSVPRPGEITLAHRGVLFLDELPEFPRPVLESLRQPLEEGTITISRAQGTAVFPAQLLLVAAMNPCPCGFAGDSQRACTCNPKYIASYTSRLSGPLLDRIDLHVSVPRVPWQEWQSSDVAEPSAAVRERVVLAREKQTQRLGAGRTNSSITPSELRRYCAVDAAGEQMLGKAVERLGLSGRSISRVLKISRTIADLAESEAIAASHLAEALQYRPKS
jgi:magnesium chelatase family protein